MSHLESSTNIYNTQDNDSLRIGIIGAGAAGLAALKVLKDTHYVSSKAWEITAFEERDDVGGVWLPSVPSNPYGKDQRKLEPPATPLYDSLTTNLPHPIMGYRSYMFPPETPLFPPADIVETYLHDFAKAFDLMPHVHLKSKVVDACWDSKVWRLSVTSSSSIPKIGVVDDELTKLSNNFDVASSKMIKVYEFDRLIVANGHYHIPRFPDLPGIDNWLRVGRAWHSAWYRNPNDHRLAGRVIAVVGGGPSGQDISKELLKVASAVILCAPDATPTSEPVENPGGGESKHPRLILRGRVVGFTENWAIQFEDGTFEKGIDYCILATGYESSFPFFPSDVMQCAMPLPVPPLPEHLHNSSYHVFPLAKQLFPLQTDYPAGIIAFPGLLWRAAPLPIFEAQMQAIIKVFANPSSLDITAEATDIVTRYERLRREVRNKCPDAVAVRIGRAWHSYPDDEAFDYRDDMHLFAGLNDAKWMVPSWARDIYKRKVEIRDKWIALEQSGEAAEWLKGVGHSGDVQEWVDLMWRVLEREDTNVASQVKL